MRNELFYDLKAIAVERRNRDITLNMGEFWTLEAFAQLIPCRTCEREHEDFRVRIIVDEFAASPEQRMCFTRPCGGEQANGIARKFTESALA